MVPIGGKQGAPYGGIELMPSRDETFVARMNVLLAGFLAVVLVGCAVMWLFFAAMLVATNVDHLLLRVVVVAAGLILLVLAIYSLLMINVIANRVEVGPKRVKLRIARMRGPLPISGLIRAEVPYDDIASIETREEVYSSFGLTTVLRAFSLVTRDGARFPLGVMTENSAAQPPYDQAAQRIAARAGVAVVDKGAVRVGGIVRGSVHDTPSWSSPAMTPVENAKFHHRAVISIQIVGLLAAAVILLRSCSHS